MARASIDNRILKKTIPGFFSSQRKKRGFCSAPFLKHLRVRKIRGASVHRSSRLRKIIFQQPARAVKRFKRVAALTLLAALLAYPAVGVPNDVPYNFSDPVLQKRYKDLLTGLRCLVCQNQTLAESNADLAQDMRTEIYKMMSAGASDKEVISFMTDRYGDFVLYRPPFKPITYLLWSGPTLLLVFGGAVIYRLARRRAAQRTARLSKEERRRVAELLGGEPTEGGRS